MSKRFQTLVNTYQTFSTHNLKKYKKLLKSLNDSTGVIPGDMRIQAMQRVLDQREKSTNS